MNQRYQLKEELGRGGLGIVHRAFDTQLGREVAVKRVLIDSGEPVDNLTEGLIKEARILSTLKHPHVVTIHDVGADEEGPFVVMELLEGETIDTLIEKAPLPFPDFERFATQSLEGLAAAHSLGLIHRDLKPTNLMLVWLPGGKFQVKILDFGLAEFAHGRDELENSQDDSILGSIHFMTPEQFERAPLDVRTDLYSLGCIFYFTLTGQYPCQGKDGLEVMTAHLHHQVTPLHDLRPDIPESVCFWIDSLMAREKNDRPGDAQAALDSWNPDPIIDEKQLREVTCNDPSVAGELLTDFTEETAGLLEQLRRELESKQPEKAEATARTLRGTASTLGYLELTTLASAIETSARMDPELCLSTLDRIEPAILRLENTVAKLRWEDTSDTSS